MKLNTFCNLPQTQLKLLQKEQLKKTAETTGDLIGSKIVNKIIKSSKNHDKILQIQLKGKQKHLEKDIYLQKKGRQLLIS